MDVTKLTDEELFKLLDERTEKLKKHSKPLGERQTKNYASLTAAELGDDVNWDSVSKISKQNQQEQDKKELKRISNTEWEESVKVKRRRDEWID